MDIYLLILLIGFCYAVLFGAMSFIRHEGFSLQFTLEAVALTIAVAGGVYLTGSEVNPILFLVFLYLVTMRSRLLTDLANLLSSRGRQRDAISLLQVALRLFPDKPSRLIVLVNMGVVQLLRKNPKSAEALLSSVLEESKEGGLGIRYEAACHYNLGMALLRQGKEAQAVRQFSAAASALPGSVYSSRAEKMLEERRSGASSTADRKVVDKAE
jgi:tetratricopeptide (TPR) repeat protein